MLHTQISLLSWSWLLLLNILLALLLIALLPLSFRCSPLSFHRSSLISPFPHSHSAAPLRNALLPPRLNRKCVCTFNRSGTFAPLQIDTLQYCSIAKGVRKAPGWLKFREKIYMFFRLLRAVKSDFLFFIKLFSITGQFGTLLV